MPTYDYECPVCNERLELFHSIAEEPQKICSSCSTGTLRRIISKGSGVIFKGSGFYSTDSRKENSKKTQSKEPTTASDSTSSGKKDANKAKAVHE